MEAALLALVAILGTMGTVFGPLLIARQLNRARSAEKKEDWARQDAVAAEARKQQDEVADQAREAARLLLAANERVAQTAKITNGKLDTIHVLVNSSMTTAMQNELEAIKRELIMMLEIVELKEAAGKEPTIEALAAIEATKIHVNELEVALSDRLRQNELVVKQGQRQRTR